MTLNSKTLIASAALAAALTMTASAADATTYTGVQDVGGNTVDLSITTDGQFGLIQAADITAFDIDVSGPVGNFAFVDPVGPDGGYSQVEIPGFTQPLLATPSALTLTINPSNANQINFLAAYPGNNTYFAYFCVGASCGIGGNVTGESVGLYYYGSGLPYTLEAVSLGTAVSAAPEPSAWALMIAGVGVVGSMLRRRKIAPLAIPTTASA
jgi:hypothetical protein